MSQSSSNSTSTIKSQERSEGSRSPRGRCVHQQAPGHVGCFAAPPANEVGRVPATLRAVGHKPIRSGETLRQLSVDKYFSMFGAGGGKA